MAGFNKTDAVSILSGVMLLLAVLGSVVYLAHDKVLNGEAVIGIVTSIVTMGGAALAVHSGVSAGARAANGVKRADDPH